MVQRRLMFPEPAFRANHGEGVRKPTLIDAARCPNDGDAQNQTLQIYENGSKEIAFHQTANILGCRQAN